MLRTSLRLPVAVIAAAVLGVAGCGGGGSDTKTDASEGGKAESLKGRTLNVVTWGGVWTDATKKNFTDPFAKENGVKVNFIVSGTDPTAPVLLQEQQGNVKIDLVDGGTAGRLESLGYLEHFPADLKSSLEASSRPGTVQDHVLEYGSTATLIVCNPELVDKCPATAKEFWDTKNFPGDRAFAASYSSAMAFALLADGVAKDQLFPMDVDRAISKLEEIKPHIKVWPDSGSKQEQVMTDKEVGIAFMWNGRAHVVQRDHIPGLVMNWDDSVVSSGGGFSVPKDAPNKDVAFALLQWIGDHPEAQAAWTEALTYPTPTKELLNLVPKDIGDALPAAHDPALIPALDLAEQSGEMQKAWQQFLTG